METVDEPDPLALIFPEEGIRHAGVSVLAPRQAGRGPLREVLPPASFGIDPLLVPVFRAFEQSGVRWCLLRIRDGETALESPGQEIVALVDRPALATAYRILKSNGFAAVPASEAPRQAAAHPTAGVVGHARFVGYNPKTDHWVVMELAGRLSYGPYAALETGAEGGCLERRRWESGLYVLGADDAFWTLLFHLMFDRRPEEVATGPGATPPAFSRLERLVADARTDGPLARLVAKALPPGWGPEHLVDCVWEGEWDVLEKMAPVIREEWEHIQSWAARRRALARRGRHRLARRLPLTGAPGISVALLAPDLAAKSALANDLGRSFYLPVTYVRMGAPPRRGRRTRRLARAGFFRTISTQWKRYLVGRVRRSRGRLVVFDRYSYDARLPAPRKLKPLAKLRRFLLGRACPAPDLVVVLDAPTVLWPRKGRLGARAEVPREVLRMQYLDLAQRLPDAIVIEAAAGSDRLRRDVTAAIWRAYASAPPSVPRRFVARLHSPLHGA